MNSITFTVVSLAHLAVFVLGQLPPGRPNPPQPPPISRPQQPVNQGIQSSANQPFGPNINQPPSPFGQPFSPPRGSDLSPNFFDPNAPPRFFPAFFKHEPTYLVVASRTVRPGSVYKIIVDILKHTVHSLVVRASISRDGVEVAGANHVAHPAIQNQLLLKVPETSVPGKYKLRVEGNVDGAMGATYFANETELQFFSRFLTVLIQTNKPVYNRLQRINFRVILLTTDLKPYSDPVEVFILDPKGYIMRRWFSVHSNVGVVSVYYTLPSDPVVGHWTIRVVALNQVEEKKIIVEKYYFPRFDVNVTLPTFILDTDYSIRGVVQANYTNYAPVFGNATIRLVISPSRYTYSMSGGGGLGGGRPSSPGGYNPPDIHITMFNGTADFEFSMAELLYAVPQLDGAEIKVEASVYDRFLEISNSGFAKARIINRTLSLRFLGPPKIFKPGVPITGYVAVSYHDLEPLPAEKLVRARIEIRPTFGGGTGIGPSTDTFRSSIPDEGVVRFEIDTPLNAERIELQAVYTDDDERIVATTTALAFYSRERRFIHVTTSTMSAVVGEYIVFSVRANFYMEYFNYVIVAKGIVVHGGSEKVQSVLSAQKTFSVPLSSEMAPTCRIVIYHVTTDGELLSDSLIVPVSWMSRHRITLDLNQKKDKLAATVELSVTGNAGAYYGVSVMEMETFALQAGNELSPASISESMMTFEKDFRRLTKVQWTSRAGNPDRVEYFHSPNYAVDPNKTFAFSDLIVFTDARVVALPDPCNETLGIISCMDGRCFPENKKCDGRQDCSNGFDESDCPDDKTFELRHFKLYRKNHIERFYDAEVGDWAWIGFNLSPEGDEIFPIGPVPHRPATWVVNAFSVSKDFGLGIISEPYVYDGRRPFFVTIEMPTMCTRGEQMGVRVEVFNLQPSEVYAVVVLEGSPDYKFVHVEDEGIVTSYNPRTSYGEIHHLIWVPAHQSKAVHVPVVAARVGEIEIVIGAYSQVGKDVIRRKVMVEADGVSQFLHTSMLLDLKIQPVVLKFLDINVTETPIVPYEKWRRYIFDSPKCHASIVGDVVGPAFPKMPVTTDILLRRPDRGCEPQVFNFAANLWTLEYLRRTNQWNWPLAREAFQHLNVFYSWVMVFQNPEGSFSQWKKFEPSVWLSSYVARVFQQARFADWERYLYIDPKVIEDAIMWVLRFQSKDGSFYEATPLPLDRKMDPRVKLGGQANNFRFMNISLTAHVLITLCKVNDLQGELRMKINNAKLRATQFLEHRLSNLQDPYDVAITTYALTLAGSVEKELGFEILDGLKIEQEGSVYWSRDVAPLPKIVMENQRPFLQARWPGKWDALSVEASSYALMVYILREGLIQEQIVKWLNTMRNTDGGFISTIDTIAAMEALTEYSFRARLREVTDMRVTMESSAEAFSEKTYTVVEDYLSKLQVFDVKNVYGYVGVVARGAGLGILQLDVQYNIDHVPLLIPPAIRAFDLNVTARYGGRNASIIAVHSCQRWLLTSESPASGAAVLEMDVPTGYYQYQPDLDELVARRGISNLRRIKIMERKIYVYFNYLDTQYTCIDFQLQRWYPVANLTQYMKVRVYDYYAPERYNESIFQAFNLYVLSICQVCGSFQCPYCPFYNLAPVVHISFTVLLASLLTLLILDRFNT